MASQHFHCAPELQELARKICQRLGRVWLLRQVQHIRWDIVAHELVHFFLRVTGGLPPRPYRPAKSGGRPTNPCRSGSRLRRMRTLLKDRCSSEDIPPPQVSYRPGRAEDDPVGADGEDNLDPARRSRRYRLFLPFSRLFQAGFNRTPVGIAQAPDASQCSGHRSSPIGCAYGL